MTWVRAPLITFAAVAIAVLATLVTAAVVGAAQELPAGVDNYASELHEIENTRGRQSLEDLFELGIEVGPRLQGIANSLDAPQLKALREEMRGFVIERGENASVHPSADFFLKLARKKGTRVDREFFDLYARTEPDSNGGQPAYITPNGNAPGCTRFDGPLMIALYRGWLGFRTAHPEDYAAAAQNEIDRLTTELRGGTCACGSKEQVIAALEKFSAAFPDVPMTPMLRDRIERIRRGTSQIRFECKQ